MGYPFELVAKLQARGNGIERSPCYEKSTTTEQIRQEISSLLSEWLKGEGKLLTELMTKAVQRVLQEALEQELTDHLGRDYS
jgi:hypothetical protein